MEYFLVEAVYLVLILSIVPVGIVGLACGVVVAIQSATQIQEQSIVHLIRIVVFGALVYLMGQGAYLQLESFFVRGLLAVESVGRL